MAVLLPCPARSRGRRAARADWLGLRPACLSGNSGPKNVWHYLLGQDRKAFNRNFHVGVETDEVCEAWTRATQIVRPNCCHPAGDGAFLGSWVRRNYLRRSDRGDEAKPVELLSRVRQQREVVPGSC